MLLVCVMLASCRRAGGPERGALSCRSHLARRLRAAPAMFCVVGWPPPSLWPVRGAVMESVPALVSSFLRYHASGLGVHWKKALATRLLGAGFLACDQHCARKCLTHRTCPGPV